MFHNKNETTSKNRPKKKHMSEKSVNKNIFIIIENGRGKVSYISQYLLLFIVK